MKTFQTEMYHSVLSKSMSDLLHFSFNVKNSSDIKLKIYNVRDKSLKVLTLLEKIMMKLKIDIQDLKNGIYFVTLQVIILTVLKR